MNMVYVDTVLNGLKVIYAIALSTLFIIMNTVFYSLLDTPMITWKPFMLFNLIYPVLYRNKQLCVYYFKWTLFLIYSSTTGHDLSTPTFQHTFIFRFTFSIIYYLESLHQGLCIHCITTSHSPHIVLYRTSGSSLCHTSHNINRSQSWYKLGAQSTELVWILDFKQILLLLLLLVLLLSHSHDPC